MSRIGKKPIVIPEGVQVDIHDGNVTITGPKGTLSQAIPPRLRVSVDGGNLLVEPVNALNQKDTALWGTLASILTNIVRGVTTGFKRQLEINGVGYKAALKGKNLALEVGFTHTVDMVAPPGISFTVEKNIITVEGIDKQLVGEMAAQIRRVKKPEPYKGKGIKFIEEVIQRKAGKTAAKAAA